MSNQDSRRSLASELAAAADAYQAAAVIPHCSVCAKPCCRLDALVLELEWKQIRTFWKLGESRKTFDRQLAAGKGPEEIRAANGLYYVHSKPCPAYDLAGHGCTIYGQDIKPAGCSDFPVYEDMGSVTADLRCEAVNLDALVAWLARAVGPAFRIVQSADAEFPFLVTLAARKKAGQRPPRA
ncbi:MAG: hypothetical protein H6R15_1055 [Proteobacteria bacterium]|nr:hypothetical protein [Pseudomonadota bacterium]